jgi:hypothetical protein
MRVEPGQPARGIGSPTWWARIRLLPRPVQLLAFLLFVSALAPALAELNVVLADPARSTWLGVLARYPALVRGLSLAAALGTLIATERPRSLSPVAYARQLRERFAVVQADFDGALRRRSNEEEEERHAPSPHPSDP